VPEQIRDDLPWIILVIVFLLPIKQGTSTRWAIAGIKGTTFSCLNIAILNTFIGPNHAREWHESAILLSNLAIFVFLALFLNLDGCAREFGLCYFTAMAMHFFMDPAASGIFADFRSWDSLTDLSTMTVGNMLQMTVGCTIAIIATSLIPVPLSRAYDHGKEDVMMMSQQTTALFRALVEYYTSEQDPEMLDRFIYQMTLLNNLSSSLEKNLTESWWETFDIGRKGTTRFLAGKHLTTIRLVHDRLYGTAVALQEEEFDEQHDLAIRKLKVPLMRLTHTTNALLLAATTITACDSREFTEQDEEELKKLMAGCSQRNLEVSAALNRLRKETFKTDEEGGVCNEGLQQECYVCFSLCAYARLVQRYAEVLIEDVQETRTPKCCSLCRLMAGGICMAFRSVLAIFDWGVIGTRDRFMYAFRNSIAILMGFLAGMLLFENPTPIIPSTICLLLSSPFGMGSQLRKNLRRLQGVVLGVIVGQLMFQLQACRPWAKVSIGITFFVYETLCLYFNYSLEEHNLVALLLGAYGGPILLQRAVCEASKHEAFAKQIEDAVYYKIQHTTCAILIMTLVDLPFALQNSPSVQARKTLQTALCSLRDTVSTLSLDGQGTQSSVATLRGILSKLGTAKELGKEAANELRPTKSKWPAALFNDIVEFSEKWYSDMLSLEFAIKGSHVPLPWEDKADGTNTDGIGSFFNLIGKGEQLAVHWEKARGEVVSSMTRAILLIQRCFDQEAQVGGYIDDDDDDDVGHFVYFKLTCLALRSGSRWPRGLRLSSWALKVDGKRIEKVLDTQIEGNSIALAFSGPVKPDGYLLTTTAEGDVALDPAAWKLEGSSNFRDWKHLAKEEGVDLPRERGAEAHFQLSDPGTNLMTGKRGSFKLLSFLEDGEPEELAQTPSKRAFTSGIVELQETVNGWSDLSLPKKTTQSLEDDAFTQLSVVLLMLRTSLDHIKAIERHVLQHSFVDDRSIELGGGSKSTEETV